MTPPDRIDYEVDAILADPLKRFLDSLPEHLRKEAERAIELQQEVYSRTQQVFMETNQARAFEHIAWLRQYLPEAAARYHVFHEAFTRFVHTDCPPITIVRSSLSEQPSIRQGALANEPTRYHDDDCDGCLVCDPPEEPPEP